MMTSDLDLRRLRFFVQVVQHGGFSAAANSLASTQSTVSKAIKQLEDELGVVLLQRSNSRIDLTDEGRLVYDEAVRLLAAARRLKTDLDELKGLRRGQLTLGMPRMGTTVLLADAMATYKLKYPLIELDVEVASPAELERQLRESELEVAAVFEPAPDGLHFRPLLEDELMVVVSASHPLSSGDGIDLAALRGVPLFLFGQDIPAAQAVMEAFDAAGVEPHVAARSSQLDVLYELVKSGAGATFVPSQVAHGRSQGATVARPLQGARIPWRLGLGWMRGRHLSHAAHAWIDHALGARTPAQGKPR
jgi:DNA-binding transcriptional LysR family regulator